MNSSLPVVASTKSCRRCEQVPDAPQGAGTLHLRFPLSHSRSKILSHFYESHLPCTQSGEVLSVEIEDEDLAEVLSPLQSVLSSVEQADVRVLFEPRGYQMQLADYLDADNLDSFIARAQSGWLLDMLREDRLTTWFQPIVGCESQEVFAYECLMRGEENGQTVFPRRIIDIARGAGLLFQLDRAARLVAIRNAAAQGLGTSSTHASTRIFINFIPTAIYDPVNCLGSTMKAVEECGLKPENVVFEVVESELIQDTNHLKTILDYYRARGFGVALDDVGAGFSGLNLLNEVRPDFIKLDMQLTRDVWRDPYKAVIARKVLEIARDIGIQTVCEGVETAEEHLWLCEHGADYEQGYYFGKPAPQIRFEL